MTDPWHAIRLFSGFLSLRNDIAAPKLTAVISIRHWGYTPIHRWLLRSDTDGVVNKERVILDLIPCDKQQQPRNIRPRSTIASVATNSQAGELFAVSLWNRIPARLALDEFTTWSIS
jgi:hypothetical protein